MKKFFNVIGILLAIPLTIVLTLTLILTPVWQGVSGLLQPDFLQNVTTEIVEELDLSEISLNDPELVQELAEAGISQEAAEAILASNTLHELVQILGTDLSLVVLNRFEASGLTEAELNRIVSENLNELVQIFRLLQPQETASLTDDQLAQAVSSFLLAEGASLADQLNAELGNLQTDLHTEYAMAMELLTGTLVTTVALIAAAVLAILIFLLRWPRQEGLLWLGISSALAALPVLGIAVSFKGSQLTGTLAQDAEIIALLSPVLRHTGNTMLVGGLILVALAAAFIALFLLLRSRRLKKAAAHQDYAPAANAVYPDYAPVEAAPVNDAPAAESDGEPRQRSPWDNV